MRPNALVIFRRSAAFSALLAFTLLGGAARADDDDPAKGKFTLEEATKGLSGSGPLTAKIETTLGTFTCELYEKQAPITVANFVGLARGLRPWKDPKTGQWVEKKPFYDGLIFHRVIPGFMIQGGDPLGVRHRQPRLQLRGRVLARSQVRQAGAAGDGQRRPGDERVAVLHHRRDAPASERPAHHLRPVRARFRWSPRSRASRAARATNPRRRRDEEGDDRARQGQGEVGLRSEAFRPRHQRPASRSPRDLPVRGQRSRHPDLRHRGDRHVQEGGVGARPQRARGGAAARRASRGAAARLSDGVAAADGGGKLRVASAARSVPTTLRESQIADHLILRSRSTCATRTRRADDLRHQGRQPAHPRRRARPHVEDFEAERIDIDELYSGMTELPVPGTDVDAFYAQGTLAADRGRAEVEPVRAAARSRQPVAQRARPLRRRPPRSWCRCASCATASGASGRATRSSTARSTCCSTTTSSWSRWSARRAPARRCSRSPPACRRSSRSRSTRSCWCRARSSRSAATSATCPATSRRSSIPGCSRSTTTSSS